MSIIIGGLLLLSFIIALILAIIIKSEDEDESFVEMFSFIFKWGTFVLFAPFYIYWEKFKIIGLLLIGMVIAIYVWVWKLLGIILLIILYIIGFIIATTD